MLTLWLSVLICIAGALIYGLSNGKASALGKDMFWVGLLVTLLQIPSHIISLLPH